MRGFFERLKWKFLNWMEGRNGSDDLTNFLVIVGVVVLLIGLIFSGSIFGMILDFVALALFIWAMFRCFSKNVYARQKENDKYLSIIAKPKRTFNLWGKMWKNRKTTKYFKCKGCGQVLSVPRGKGTLRVVCPKCKTETTKKS